MNVRIVVPRRPDGGWRDRLWEYCRAYWAEQLPWPIEEGHHDQGPFSRAAAINRGAQGDWDVLVILDGDIIGDPQLVREAVDVAAKTGQLVLPYHRRRLLGRGGTRRIVLRGYEGPWESFVSVDEGRKHYSSIVCVPRALWDHVGGFDERYEGWGGEDDAFHAACKVIGGGFERLRGDVWHLWHPPSDHRSWDDPLYKQALALTQRYWRARTPDQMQRLLSEDRGHDQVIVVCLTNGARDTLTATLASAEEMLDGPIGRRVIANDSGRPIVVDGWEDVRIGKGSGYTRATAAALTLASESGQPWVFFLEDDFTFNEPIDLTDMQRLMGAHPELVQLSLKRQPWYDYEVTAGGIIEVKPEQFTQRPGYVEHRYYWAQNPMLCRRALLAQHPWPQCPGSERAFGNLIFEADPSHVAGIYGRIEDPPRVTHHGVERAGAHY
ncbi:MAG: hypothetical protein JWM47_4531 [Acidimicrobiales bacterium]|nr:hypothetical protein [Acidimicrobiales bacterium]